MTVIPDLREAIADAALRHYGGEPRHRPRRSSLRMGLATTTACSLLLAIGVAALVLIQTNGIKPEGGTAGQHGTSVPDSTIAASAQLTHAPAVAPPGTDGTRPEPIADSDLERAAQELQAQIPFPPSTAKDIGWLRTDGDMAQIDYHADLQALIEFRAGCEWLRFWLAAVAAGDSLAASGSATVLADIPAWPTNRGARTSAGADNWTEIAHLANRGDVPGMRNAQRDVCSTNR
jgi:hypothetical protein